MKPNDIIASKLRKHITNNIEIEDDILYIDNNMKYEMLYVLCKYDKKYEKFITNKLNITREELGELIERRKMD